MAKEKNKGGRPSKFDSINLDQVKLLASKGWTDKEMAVFFQITEQTWNNYKQRHQEFFESLKNWKEIADGKVVRSLYERATGYEHEDTYFASYQGTIIKETYTKHYPPDPTSMIFWLKNRKRAEWKDRFDNYEHEDIELPEDIDNMSPEKVTELYEQLKNKKT